MHLRCSIHYTLVQHLETRWWSTLSGSTWQTWANVALCMQLVLVYKFLLQAIRASHSVRSATLNAPFTLMSSCCKCFVVPPGNAAAIELILLMAAHRICYVGPSRCPKRAILFFSVKKNPPSRLTWYSVSQSFIRLSIIHPFLLILTTISLGNLGHHDGPPQKFSTFILLLFWLSSLKEHFKFGPPAFLSFFGKLFLTLCNQTVLHAAVSNVSPSVHWCPLCQLTWQQLHLRLSIPFYLKRCIKCIFSVGFHF